MLDYFVLGKIWLVGFGLNLIWEFSHCRLYETCRQLPRRRVVTLLITMAGKDGLLIVLFYLTAAWLWRSAALVDNIPALFFFATLSVGFAFADEKMALRLGRWKYAKAMPVIAGVGLSPLLELALTGLVTLLIVIRWL